MSLGERPLVARARGGEVAAAVSRRPAGRAGSSRTARRRVLADLRQPDGVERWLGPRAFTRAVFVAADSRRGERAGSSPSRGRCSRAMRQARTAPPGELASGMRLGRGGARRRLRAPGGGRPRCPHSRRARDGGGAGSWPSRSPAPARALPAVVKLPVTWTPALCWSRSEGPGRHGHADGAPASGLAAQPPRGRSRRVVSTGKPTTLV